MEVHHHPEVGKKNFKEYFLEGLMIFLAVTMGFFAESLRENINNKEREKSYISSLVNNLKDDTFYLNNAIDHNKAKIKGLDTLLSLSSRNMAERADRQTLYRLFSRYVSWYSGFSSNDATMMQLKNSGGLQYIRRDHVADSIAVYDKAVTNISAAAAPYSKSINDAVDATAALLIFNLKRDSIVSNDKAQSDGQFPLLTNDRNKMDIFFNKIYLERGWTVNYVNSLMNGLPAATALIPLLKSKYDLD
jgi:hypothetical protein